MGSKNAKGGGAKRPGLLRIVAMGLTIAAVVKELRLRPEERTWHGTIAGFVPYEFRMPTLERAKERWWNPDGAHLFGPQVFGVGWTVNLGRVVALIKERLAES